MKNLERMALICLAQRTLAWFYAFPVQISNLLNRIFVKPCVAKSTSTSMKVLLAFTTLQSSRLSSPMLSKGQVNRTLSSLTPRTLSLSCLSELQEVVFWAFPKYGYFRSEGQGYSITAPSLQEAEDSPWTLQGCSGHCKINPVATWNWGTQKFPWLVTETLKIFHY